MIRATLRSIAFHGRSGGKGAARRLSITDDWSMHQMIFPVPERFQTSEALDAGNSYRQ